MFGAVLAMLWATHNSGDHVVQTDVQAANKADTRPGPYVDEDGARRPGWIQAMAGHVGGYTAVQVAGLVALRAVGIRPTLGSTVAAVTWSAATHAILDRRTPVTAVLRRVGAPRFAALTSPICGGYLADQALHHAALTISALLLARGSRPTPTGGSHQR
ncbi:hypothetical protein [Pseudonocardia sp. HH130630-07]|uniref:hypothetical protein n=1 Tax=Pseudonocardia sp. HH130630-07 TaxID=1690815 RepID=UPI000814C613|nr:hypothetical protein [Pseudonocardia sp. HH130630-07]ANY10637.1 hypothetical protein AFB00_29975 [Pseudonocardia sp. HH130630-07]